MPDQTTPDEQPLGSIPVFVELTHPDVEGTAWVSPSSVTSWQESGWQPVTPALSPQKPRSGRSGSDTPQE